MGLSMIDISFVELGHAILGKVIIFTFVGDLSLMMHKLLLLLLVTK